MTDKLICAIEDVLIEGGCTGSYELAQAALDAIAAAGYAVVPGAELCELLAAAQTLCEYGHSDNAMRDRLRRAGKAYDAARAAALAGRES